MSTNIDHTETPVLEAAIHVKDLKKLQKKYEDELPEGCFLNDLDAEDADKDGYVRLRSFDWYGQFSGTSHDMLVKKIAPKIKGDVEAIFTWEGGEFLTGLLIKDGKVAECEIEQRLVKPKGW